MDNYNDNKATPKKRTGENHDNNTKDRNDNDNARQSTPEIVQPNPPSAIPSFPVEMPVRNDVPEK